MPKRRKIARRPSGVDMLSRARTLFFRKTPPFFFWGASIFLCVAPFSFLFAADGSCLWGGDNEKTTYSPPYYPYMAPEIPVLARPETATTPGIGVAPSVSPQITNGSATPGGTPNVVSSDFEAKLQETGTIVGRDGKTYSYSYIRGVQPYREVASTWVYETPPGGLFPIWLEKKTERIVWKPVLIKLFRPLNESAPEPCVPVANSVDADAPDAANPGGLPVPSSVVPPVAAPGPSAAATPLL